MRSLIVALILSLAASASAGELVSVVTTSGRTYLVELDDTVVSGKVTGIDAATGDRLSLDSSEIRQQSPTTEDGALIRLGHLRFLAWKVRSVIGTPQTGKVADLDSDYVYTTLAGTKVVQGEELNVYRIEGELKDPDTGRVLGIKKSALAKIKVEEVTDNFSKARRLDQTEVKVGDIVEQDKSRKAVAVLPFLDSEGQEIPAAKAASEQVSTGLKNQGITLVERSRYNEVVGELALQTNILFDQTQIQQIGRHLGATAVVFGTLTTKGTRYEIHAKIVKVDTAEIIAAARYDGGAIPPNIVPAVQTVQQGQAATLKLDPARAKKKPLTYLFANQKEIDRNWGVPVDPNLRRMVNGNFSTREELTSSFMISGDCEIAFTYATCGNIVLNLFGERFLANVDDGRSKTPKLHRVLILKKGNELAVRLEDGKTQVITLRDDQANSSSRLVFKPGTQYQNVDRSLFPVRLDLKADSITDPETVNIGAAPIVPAQPAPPRAVPNMTNRDRAAQNARDVLEQRRREPEKKP